MTGITFCILSGIILYLLWSEHHARQQAKSKSESIAQITKALAESNRALVAEKALSDQAVQNQQVTAGQLAAARADITKADRLNKERGDLSQLLHGARAEISRLNGQIAKFKQNQPTNARLEIDRLNARLRESQEAVTKLQAKLIGESCRLQRRNQRVESLAFDLAEADRKLRDVQNSRDMIYKDRQELRLQAKKDKELIATQDATIRALKVIVSRLGSGQKKEGNYNQLQSHIADLLRQLHACERQLGGKAS